MSCYAPVPKIFLTLLIVIPEIPPTSENQVNKNFLNNCRWQLYGCRSSAAAL